MEGVVNGGEGEGGGGWEEVSYVSEDEKREREKKRETGNRYMNSFRATHTHTCFLRMKRKKDGSTKPVRI